MSATSRGPTIVLIGGEATLDSGAAIDSRQPLAGDEWDVVLRQALGEVGSLVDPCKGIRRHRVGSASAARCVGPFVARRQVPQAAASGWELHAGPTQELLRRPRVPNRAGYADNESGKFSSDAASSRYRILPYLLRFDDMRGGSAPVVIVGGFHTTYDDGTDIVGDRPIDYFVSLAGPKRSSSFPTPRSSKRKDAQRRRNRPPAPRRSVVWRHTDSAESRRYEAGLEHTNDLRRADSFVINHDFRITFWADEGAVEIQLIYAALTFVKSRYDLNLGLWDLARDAALRETLLTREGIAAPIERPAVVPEELARKATEKAAERQEAEATEQGTPTAPRGNLADAVETLVGDPAVAATRRRRLSAGGRDLGSPRCIQTLPTSRHCSSRSA